MNPIPVVGAIIEVENDKVLLVRNKGWPKNFFGLVTGFLEKKDENVKSAIIREVKEELNLDVDVSELIGIYSFHLKNELLIIFKCIPKATPINIKLNNELEDFKLVPIHRLKPWPHSTGEAVKDYLTKKMQQNKNSKL